MRYSKQHKEETRQNIFNAALNKFRTEGYNGIGVDGISKAAGVTSGAFYKHFGSKPEAFRSIVSEGLSILKNAIAENQVAKGDKWLNPFIKWYFSLPPKGAKPDECGSLPMEGGCALPTLSPEVPRTDEDTQKVYEEELQKIVSQLVEGLPKGSRLKRQQAWAILSMMIGGIVLSRSVHEEKTSEEISKSMIATIRKLTAE